MRNPCSALAIVAVVATASGSGARAQAQSGDDHTAHHPDGAPAQAIQTPPPASSSGMGMPEMQRMQGAQGGMPGMMGDMGRMMEMMHSRMAGMAMMRPLEHIEGQIAFYRAELGITDAQQAQWTAFADALRTGAGKLRQTVLQSMQAGGPTPAPDQFQRRIELVSTQLEVMQSVSAAVGPLYSSLSPEQKRKADELMAEHFRSMREMAP